MSPVNAITSAYLYAGKLNIVSSDKIFSNLILLFNKNSLLYIPVHTLIGYASKSVSSTECPNKFFLIFKIFSFSRIVFPANGCGFILAIFPLITSLCPPNTISALFSFALFNNLSYIDFSTQSSESTNPIY